MQKEFKQYYGKVMEDGRKLKLEILQCALHIQAIRAE